MKLGHLYTKQPFLCQLLSFPYNVKLCLYPKIDLWYFLTDYIVLD